MGFMGLSKEAELKVDLKSKKTYLNDKMHLKKLILKKRFWLLKNVFQPILGIFQNGHAPSSSQKYPPNISSVFGTCT
jgi:hypothetical protein